MTDGISLSLRAWPAPDEAANSLPSLIPRINQQRGHFRLITEESLLEEIKAEESADGTAKPEEPEDEGNDVKTEDAPNRKEEVMLAREEIGKQIAQAYNEVYLALDFVSLLLSKDTPRQAEISMSPHVKAMIPLGSLGSDRIREPQLSEAERHDQALVLRGWKLQSLETAADALLNSAKRLQKEVESEGKYWEQVLAVRHKGWSVCRLPQERHTLGVRFGFREAAAEFKARGLAALRRGEDGSIIFDQGLRNAQSKIVRVRIRQENVITGTSFEPEEPRSEDLPIEDLILQSRNSIYEEELFYELAREARVLANQGIRTIDDTIIIPLGDTTQILVDLIPINSDPTDSAKTEQATNNAQDANMAYGIALALRILLSHSHRLNLQARSRPQPPITERKRAIPPYNILRPILTQLLHQRALRSIRKLLTELTSAPNSAGLESSFTISAYTNCAAPPRPSTMPTKTTKLSKKPISHIPPTPADTLITRFRDRLESTATVLLPGPHTLTITLRTSIHPPILGTEYNITHTTPPTARPLPTPQPAKIASPAELEIYLSWLLALAVTSFIQSLPSPSPASSSDPQESQWKTPSAPHNPTTELHKYFPEKAMVRRLKVECPQPGRLVLRWSDGVGGGKVRRVAWGGMEGNGEGEERALVNVVREAGTIKG